jgi:hypothetical protein
MKIDQDDIKELIANLSEGLNVEVKRWLDPSQPAGIAKIAKAALALRNRNGGYLVIGFDDVTLKPDKGNQPPDVRAAFQLDTIQGIVSRYASSLFEVGVAFAELEGQEYPVIVIPEGVRTPVAAKRGLLDSTGKELIKTGDVYFRTLSSNGTPSSSVIGPNDWADLLEICFENREADIGRFFRRHFGGDLSALVELLKATSAPPPPSLLDRTQALLNEGDRRFRDALKERPDFERQIDPKAGTWSVALVIDPAKPNQLPDDSFLNVIASSNPRYIAGWPAWLDSRTFTDSTMAPIVKEGAWQTLIVSFRDWSNHVDFYRLVPNGEFYLQRVLQDDLSNKVQPNSLLDPILVILRTAEVIAVGMAFARALGWESESTRLSFDFRWTRLKGRSLDSWSNPIVPISSYGTAHDDSVDAHVEIPLDTPVNAIAPYVEQALRPLFVLFGGYVMPSAAIEHWVQRMVERRL